jgi:arsenate reductase (thioredoxin)
MSLSLIVVLALSAGPAPSGGPGPFVQALWVVHRYGRAEAVDPANDQRVKGLLFKALGKEGDLTFQEVEGLMNAGTFKKLAGADGRMEPEEIREAVKLSLPDSRGRLFVKLKEHADLLSTSYDMIDEPHRVAGRKLAEWISRNHRPGKPLDVVVVCTGNSRRSIMGAAMGNVAAAYYGMPEVRFHSGGTTPTAFNSRTVKALQAIGIEVVPTGQEAARGEAATANPIYRIRWGSPGSPGEAAMEQNEFSKRYDDDANPKSEFAALMVCSDADEGCPVVRGSSLRVSMPYLDPKIYDGGSLEGAKYSERRDDMGRLMMSVMIQARRAVESAGEVVNRRR